jgi:CheY-like chemotaxis protein
MERNTKILVVDDQKDLRFQLAKLLENAGKKSETNSLVEQMRARLLGEKDEEEGESAEDEENTTGSYIVETAAQGQDAFEMVKKSLEDKDPYSVMFLDMRMPPGWDGLETAKRIREVDKDLEIVIMTAYADHDQSKIAEEVGVPEKMLYIKKPFQAEEIFQLALSLTSKWSIEKRTKQRKIWLEVLLRGISKIKSTGEQEDVFLTVLQAIINFTKAQSGFIAEFDESKTPKFIPCAIKDIGDEEVEAFIKEHSERLEESRTTLNFEGHYLLPMRKDDFFAVAVINKVTTSTDPEWYKLLSLLVMTSAEVLNNASNSDNESEKTEKHHPNLKETFSAIKKEAEKIMENPGKTDEVEDTAHRIVAISDQALKKL